MKHDKTTVLVYVLTFLHKNLQEPVAFPDT